MATKPTEYLDWTDDSPTKVQTPPLSQRLSGWSVGQPPPFQWVNWLFCRAGQWVRYLDETLQSVQPSANALANARLLGGGNWSFGSGSGTLAWSSPFFVALPGQQDAFNTVAAGSVVLLDGHVAYLSATLPFVTSGRTQAGSNQVLDLAYMGSIAIGHSVVGAGIPASTTVTAVAQNGVTLSQAATATATGVSLTFSFNGSPSVLVGPESTVQATPTTLILARRVGTTVVVGVGAGEMVLRDAEMKPLRGVGYLVHNVLTAGATMAAGTPVYISNGSDGGRTAGQLYPVEASVSAGTLRSAMLGVLSSAVTAGGAAQVVTGGIVSGYAGMTAGVPYYASTTTPGTLTAERPSGAAQSIVNVGIALSATQLLVNAAGAAANTQVQVGAGQGNFGVQNEAQLVAALTACAQSGGGVIIVQAPFSISQQLTLPSHTLLLGCMGGSVLTVLSGAGLNMSFASRINELHLMTTNLSGSMLNIGAASCGVRDCRFVIPTNSSGACVTVTGSGTRLSGCMFVGVVGGTAIGIRYQGGSDNIDSSSVFM